MSLEDAVKLIYNRSAVMNKATGLGKMVSVGISAAECEKLIAGFEDKVNIAANNRFLVILLQF